MMEKVLILLLLAFALANASVFMENPVDPMDNGSGCAVNSECKSDCCYYNPLTPPWGTCIDEKYGRGYCHTY